MLCFQLWNILHSITGGCNSYGRHVHHPSLLPGHHDVLGPCIWSSLDFGLFLLYLDMSSSPTVPGHKVVIYLDTTVIAYYHIYFRKLKVYRMLWLVSSIGVHIVLLMTILASFTTFSSSYLHIHHASHTTPVIVLATITTVLSLFQV